MLAGREARRHPWPRPDVRDPPRGLQGGLTHNGAKPEPDRSAARLVPGRGNRRGDGAAGDRVADRRYLQGKERRWRSESSAGRAPRSRRPADRRWSHRVQLALRVRAETLIVAVILLLRRRSSVSAASTTQLDVVASSLASWLASSSSRAAVLVEPRALTIVTESRRSASRVPFFILAPPCLPSSHVESAQQSHTLLTARCSNRPAAR